MRACVRACVCVSLCVCVRVCGVWVCMCVCVYISSFTTKYNKRIVMFKLNILSDDTKSVLLNMDIYKVSSLYCCR